MASAQEVFFIIIPAKNEQILCGYRKCRTVAYVLQLKWQWFEYFWQFCLMSDALIFFSEELKGTDVPLLHPHPVTKECNNVDGH